VLRLSQLDASRSAEEIAETIVVLCLTAAVFRHGWKFRDQRPPQLSRGSVLFLAVDGCVANTICASEAFFAYVTFK
jgi:hypothetical protein